MLDANAYAVLYETGKPSVRQLRLDLVHVSNGDVCAAISSFQKGFTTSPVIKMIVNGPDLESLWPAICSKYPIIIPDKLLLPEIRNFNRNFQAELRPV